MTKIFRCALILSLSLLTVGLASAQNPQDSNDNAAKIPQEKEQPDLTSKQVAEDLKAIEDSTAINDTIKAVLRPKYKKAIDLLQNAEEFSKTTKEFLEALNTGSETTQQYQSELKDLPKADDAINPPAPDDDAALKKVLDERRLLLNGLKDELSKIDAANIKIKVRPGEISARQPLANTRLGEVRTKLTSPELAEDATSATRIADRLELQAELIYLEAELAKLKQEQLSHAIRETLLQAQEDLWIRKVAIETRVVAFLKNEFGKRLSTEANQLNSRAAQLVNDLADENESVRALADEVEKLAVQFVDVVGYLRQTKREQDRISDRTNRLNEEYESIIAQLKLGGDGGAIAQLLLDLQRRCFEARNELRLASLPNLDQARLAALEIRKKRRSQPEIEKQFDGSASTDVEELVGLRAKVLENLRTQYSNLSAELALLETARSNSLVKTREILAFVEEQLFWLKSSPAISARTFTDIPGGFVWIFQPVHWRDLGESLSPKSRTILPVVFFGSLAFLSLLVFRSRIVKALKASGEQSRRISTDHFGLTVQALIFTLLLAIPLPLLLGIAAWTTSLASYSSGWARGLEEGLWLATLITFVNCFAYELCRAEGLADRHFRWNSDALPHNRRVLARFTAVFVPAVLFSSWCLYEQTSLSYFDSVGRICVLIANLWSLYVFWVLFTGSSGVMSQLVESAPSYLFTRSRYAWFALLLAIPVILIVLACLGFLITTYRLTVELYFSFAIVYHGVVLYLLAKRWFAIIHRRLALEEALERRRVRQEAGEQASDEVVVVDPIEEEDLDLDSVGGQTQTMIRFIFGLLIAFAVLIYWSRTIPLISYFQTIPIPLLEGLTLLGLIQVILVGVVAFVVVRNLPGLLELAVLRTTKFEAGTRFAIIQICKYTLIAIAVVWIANILNLDWAKFGWIAAALSVGLGFGLQEIVANFVCGIILLFERPIRVGDVVTVENTTGTVTNINMRATTITNWDRQEFVVPNKNLITGTILNWTLNQGLNRVVIPIGVAYGTNTDLARQILLDVARDHPKVLDEPAPMATFEAFADSSLNLVLRAYLPSLDGRLQIITELHSEIDRKFADAGIEIPFPQQDIHVRDDVRIEETTGSQQPSLPSPQDSALPENNGLEKEPVASPQSESEAATNRRDGEPLRQAN